MSSTTDKYLIITFFIINNSNQNHPYMFITENYSSKVTIMYFWAPTLKSPAKNGISKKSLDTSLLVMNCTYYFCESCDWGQIF